MRNKPNDSCYRFTELHLHALGAAIPHLLMLSVSLPPILPFAKDNLQIETRTGTVELVDEIIPEDEDEDITFRHKGKASVSIVIRLRDTSSVTTPLIIGPTKGQTTKVSRLVRTVIVQEEEQMDEDD